MKKKTVLIGISTLGLGLLGLRKIKANRDDRSLRSLVVDDLIKSAPRPKLPNNRETLNQAKEKNLKPFKLSKVARYLYGFKFMDSETIELVPRNYMAEKIVFYVHGGAYWHQPSPFHFSFLHKVSKRANARVVMPLYPKAPRANAEDVHAMIMNSYRHLIEVERINPKTITFMGDSAGAGFLLAFLQVLRDQEIPQPRHAILMSPWLDISNSNPAMQDIEAKDAMLNIKSLRYQGKIYAGALDTMDPLVSPLYGDSSNLCPIYIFTGTHDILHPDALVLFEKAQEKNWDIQIFIYDKMMHSFSQFPMPEANESIETMISIMK